MPTGILTYTGSRCEFREVISEFPVEDEKADLTVFVSKFGGVIQPFLII